MIEWVSAHPLLALIGWCWSWSCLSGTIIIVAIARYESMQPDEDE